MGVVTGGPCPGGGSLGPLAATRAVHASGIRMRGVVDCLPAGRVSCAPAGQTEKRKEEKRVGRKAGRFYTLVPVGRRI